MFKILCWLTTMLETKLYAGEEISHGDEGGEDPGHHRRRLHHVLAAFFHYVCGARVLPESHPSNRLQRAVLARILQFRDKPVYLRPLQQGLPLRFQENHLLQVLLHPTRQHPATRQWRQPIGNEVSVTICITKSARSAIYFCTVLCFFFFFSRRMKEAFKASRFVLQNARSSITFCDLFSCNRTHKKGDFKKNQLSRLYFKFKI